MEFWRIIRKWKFWKLNLRWKLGFWKIIWKWKFWKLNFKIGILKNYLKMKVLKIKLGNWNFGKLFKEVLKIRFGNWNLKKKIIWEWNFWKLEFWKNNISRLKFEIKFLLVCSHTISKSTSVLQLDTKSHNLNLESDCTLKI